MKNQVNFRPVVSVVNNQPTTTSKNVADAFGKRHAYVLDAIKNINVPDGFDREPIFRLTSQKVPMPRGVFREDPLYEITRDGFIFLVMGFTGEKAEKVKWAYIKAFNEMEAELHAKALPPPQQPTPPNRSIKAAPVPAGSKRCPKCGEVKLVTEFTRNLTSTDGLSSYCRACARKEGEIRRNRNRERNLAVCQQQPMIAVCPPAREQQQDPDIFTAGRKVRKEILAASNNAMDMVRALTDAALKIDAAAGGLHNPYDKNAAARRLCEEASSALRDALISFVHQTTSLGRAALEFDKSIFGEYQDDVKQIAQ